MPRHDYATPGAYFVTICTHGREHLLGAVVAGEVQLSSVARIVTNCWIALPQHVAGVESDVLVVMPDHVHGILHVLPEVGSSLVTAIQSFKSASTKNAGLSRTIWQRSFFDHVIRNELELEALRRYVFDNPFALSERLGLWSDP